MQLTTEHDADFPVASGGGEMGARMRAFAWDETPLGAPIGWPQSLRSTIALCLDAPVMTTLLWWPDLRLLYNDAHIPVLGDRHPVALGRPIADVGGPLWNALASRCPHALETGEGFALKSVELEVLRDGRTQPGYWDLDVTPVRGGDGDVVGLLVHGIDITDRFLAERSARESEERLRHALSVGNGVGTWDWDIPADRVRADARFAQLYGVSPDLARDGAPIAHIFGCIHPDDRAAVERTVAQAVDSGDDFAEEYRLVGADGGVRWVLARGQCEYGENGAPTRFPGVSFDITQRKQAEARQQALLELSDKLQDLSDPDEIALAASAVLGHTLDVSRVGYGVVDTVAETIPVERDWNAPGIKTIAGVLNFRDYGSYIDNLKRGETVAINDVHHDDRTRATADDLIGISAHAFVNMPLVEHGGFVALLYANHATARRWSEGDLLLMREVAERVRSATERARSEQALRVSERDLRLALSAGRFGTWKLDLLTGAIEISPALARAFDRDPADPCSYEAVERAVHPADLERWQRAHQESIVAGSDYDLEYRVCSQSGETRWITARGQVQRNEAGKPRFLTGIASDISQRKAMEHALEELNADLERRVEQRTRELVDAQEALRQSQKMEAVGQLTGGIAHDFNNLLQGITGSLQVARRRIAQGRTGDLDRFMDGAITSANRAAALTHRLLAFSRRQPLDPRPVDANALVASLEELFRRSIGETIDLSFDGAADLWDTLCDPNQLESALLNLVLNARDAMADGGRLTIATGNVTVGADDPVASHRDLPVGDYICITVSDTGSGMSAETAAKVFEPFFTTKPLGQGTGLGLSMVYGFARQSEGDVTIDSIEGAGTQIKVFLPRWRGVAMRESGAPAPAEAPRAEDGETVLVVEDEDVVRSLIVEILDELGYRALEAADGPAGAAILRSDVRIDLLITDIGLPGMNGRDVVAVGRTVRPSLKVLFMTGYAENAAQAEGFLEPGMAMVTKPIDMDALAARIRALIES